MITSAGPITTLISNADKVCSETQLSHSTHSDEDEKERVVMGFDVRHRSTLSKKQKKRESKLLDSKIRVGSERSRPN